MIFPVIDMNRKFNLQEYLISLFNPFIHSELPGLKYYLLIVDQDRPTHADFGVANGECKKTPLPSQCTMQLTSNLKGLMKQFYKPTACYESLSL